MCLVIPTQAWYRYHILRFLLHLFLDVLEWDRTTSLPDNFAMAVERATIIIITEGQHIHLFRDVTEIHNTALRPDNLVMAEAMAQSTTRH